MNLPLATFNNLLSALIGLSIAEVMTKIMLSS
jgi:hypothetical protein